VPANALGAIAIDSAATATTADLVNFETFITTFHRGKNRRDIYNTMLFFKRNTGFIKFKLPPSIR
jgi:hypothetical protein